MPFDLTFHTSQARVKRVKRILAGLPPEPPRVQQREKDDV